MDRQASLTMLADTLTRLESDDGGDGSSIIQQLPADLHSDAVDVLANVMHFVADADIRREDEQYKNMQEKEMRELIHALRRGAAREELLKFSFLS